MTLNLFNNKNVLFVGYKNRKLTNRSRNAKLSLAGAIFKQIQ